MPPETTGRKQGRFSKGESGNPAGRPKGSRNKVTEACQDLLGADAEKIMAKLVSQAKKGEPFALRLAIERLVPARAARDRCVAFDLPAVLVAADLAGAVAAVIGHAAAGDITLSEAKEFMSLIEGQRRVIETTDLVVRLEALEVAGGAAAPAARPDDEDPEIGARVRRILRREEWPGDFGGTPGVRVRR